jgi:hypothetical protein
VAAPVAATPIDLQAGDLEVTPVAHVHRSRLAFAVAVTVAALPVLVIDNISARAETNEAQVQASAGVASDPPPAPSTRVTTASSTTASTEAAEPTTTEAPTTSTEAPTTTDAVVVQAVRAPAPTTPPATAPPPPPAPPTTSAPTTYGDPGDIATWDRLARCESSGNWALNSGNGYYGGLQFSLATWQNVGGSGYPHQASKAEQIKRGQILQARAGWGQWPHCAGQLGYL